MKAIIIAAGPCKRLRPYTEETPKTLLKIKGDSIFGNIVKAFKNNGINDLAAVVGHKKEKIIELFPDVKFYENTDFWNNNILQSMMFAREHLEKALEEGEDIVMTYSDIFYEDSVVKKLVESKESIASIVDTDWHEYYEGRTDHPIDEAENVIFDDNNKMLKIGKHIFTHETPKDRQGEFIGLWKFTPEGIKTFLKHFDRLNAELKMTDPYQNTKEWQKSYITDIIQEMIDKGEEIYCVTIQKDWAEFDTVQDFLRAGGEPPEGMEK